LIRYAHPSEAASIHALLIEAFKDDVLPFTIYRAPQSVSRLAELAEERKIRVSDDLLGVAIVSDGHLAYLAVDRKARGKGLGGMLMDDFHGEGGATTLDVLANNPAFAWYQTLGYKSESESLSVRLTPKNTGTPPETWKVALIEEGKKGFSAVGHAGMRLGLLGGSALRILDLGGRSPNEALELLAMIGFAGRKEVILMGQSELPQGYETIQLAKSVRMRRNG
jgi:ribosomal protein S18 acetylase RimI-like enzyme